MFRITSGKGFHITFENGWTVSVQFGPGNYCENRWKHFEHEREIGEKGSTNAECAVYPSGGGFFAHPSFDGDIVKGEMSPKEVLELMIWAESQ